MTDFQYPSKTIQAAVENLSRLPGIGRKTALRLALAILKGTEPEAEALGNAIIDLRKNTRRCAVCGNLADPPPNEDPAAVRCGVCANPRRDAGLICVVAEAADLLALEKTQHYNGLYHVLGGIIDPMAGIGPGQLNVERLVQRTTPADGQAPVREVILALPGTMEGETTAFYISRRLQGLAVQVTHIARGIPVGSELEYTDEATLARSLQGRLPYGK